jgi:thymidine phosphorylase
MVRLSGAAPDAPAALQRVTRALDDGSAASRFLALVQALGGDASALEVGRPLQSAPVVVPLEAERAGHLAACDCFGLGELVVAMGGGRRAKEDDVDPRVGLVMLRERGAKLARGEAYAQLHLAAEAPALLERARACFTISDAAPEPLPADLVLERVG